MKKALTDFRAIQTVYSYYFPEVIMIIDKLIEKYPHGIFSKAAEKPGLDYCHVPIVKKYLNFYSSYVPALKDFSFFYPTSGAEEEIREYLVFLQQKGVKSIYILSGEYEGFKEVAITRGITTIEIDSLKDIDALPKGYWFISNPSSRDGNIIPDSFIRELCELGHKIFYDLSYLDLTEPHKFDVSHPNIDAVAVSFSKPFGLFYYRTGFTFSREPIPSLYSNIWFKNVPSLLIVNKIMNNMHPGQIPRKYKPIQKEIIDALNDNFGFGIKSSDALLLGYLSEQEAEKLNFSQKKIIKPFKRGSQYRFCLTPYYYEWELKEMNE